MREALLCEKAKSIMIVGINYSDNKFKKAQHLNTWSMYHKGKIDKVIEYTPDDLDSEFVKENKEILTQRKGAGYWLWKPYIIKKTFDLLRLDDYLFYCDAGAVILKPVQFLIDAMEKANMNVMCFQLPFKERAYSKRDAFILLDCDSDEYVDTQQRLGGYIIIKKTNASNMQNNFVDVDKLLSSYLSFCKDPRIILGGENVMGLPNYEGFVENRHDQTVWSLLTKKYGIVAFRDPSQWGKNKNLFPESTQKRSEYPVVIDSVRRNDLDNWSDYCLLRKFPTIFILRRICRKISNRIFGGLK